MNLTDKNGNPYTNWYYAQADGSLYANGWFNVDGHNIYFTKNGVFMSNRWFDLGSR